MIGYVTDPLYSLHLTGLGHPECPARLNAIASAIKDLPLKAIPAKDAEIDAILRCHTLDYIQTAQNEILSCPQGKLNILSTGDVVISSESWRVAIRAAGGVIAAVDSVIKNETSSAFCLVRPPGHHAESNAGMGFCLLNNVAIGARHAQQHRGINKIAIVDWDVHHGNGTQEIFEQDPSVFYFSTHQDPLYPGTGKAAEIGYGKGKGTTLNFPVAPTPKAREKIIDAFQNTWTLAMEAFKPDFIFISAGFDAHRDDILGNLNLTDEDFALLTTLVKNVAEKHAKGRIVSVLEGGYFLPALATSVKSHILALLS